MPLSLFDLPIVEQLSPFASFRQQGALTLLVITHPEFSAAFSLQGAQLIAWQPKSQAPVIWLSDKTEFSRGKAIRGGVPVCWPWFGPAGKPSHGFARTSDWSLDNYQEFAEQVEVSLVLRQSPATLALWPHDFSLTLTAVLSAERCDLRLNIAGDFSSTAALHSYFHIADSTAVHVYGLGEPFIDKVAGNAKSSQQGPQKYQGEVDRIFTDPAEESRIEDPLLKRTLILKHYGNSDVVTWNPGASLSESMADMSDDGYKTMVCVETARIHQPFVTTTTTRSDLGVTISVHPQ